MASDLSYEEMGVRDRAFKASIACSNREGEIWDAAWQAARDYYAPNADEANALRDRVGLTSGETNA